MMSHRRQLQRVAAVFWYRYILKALGEMRERRSHRGSLHGLTMAGHHGFRSERRQVQHGLPGAGPNPE